MLRLDEITAQKLLQVVEQVWRSRPEIIRQLVAQAKPEDFSENWHPVGEECR